MRSFAMRGPGLVCASIGSARIHLGEVRKAKEPEETGGSTFVRHMWKAQRGGRHGGAAFRTGEPPVVLAVLASRESILLNADHARPSATAWHATLVPFTSIRAGTSSRQRALANGQRG